MGPMPSAPDAPPSDEIADVFARNCRSRAILHDVVSKWGVLVLLALDDEPHRFNALRRRVDGVSERMLAQTLHTLERDGFVIREVQATIPARVEYSLTELGRRLAEKLRALVDLVEGAVDDVAEQRSRYDQKQSSE
jgi:DNA-binding HxlR family transcriptional regulator